MAKAQRSTLEIEIQLKFIFLVVEIIAMSSEFVSTHCALIMGHIQSMMMIEVLFDNKPSSLFQHTHSGFTM